MTGLDVDLGDAALPGDLLCLLIAELNPKCLAAVVVA